MKRMNGHILEFEPGTIGCQQIDAAAMNRALNAWAARRGLQWDGAFRRDIDRVFSSKKKGGSRGRRLD